MEEEDIWTLISFWLRDEAYKGKYWREFLLTPGNDPYQIIPYLLDDCAGRTPHTYIAKTAISYKYAPNLTLIIIPV